MTDHESIELSKAYVALSNAHRVDLILPMFAPEAVYTSSAVGKFAGPLEINNMMQAFFKKYPDVYWLAENYRFDNHRVTFDFSMQATAVDSDEHLQRQGIERIEFDRHGLIKILEVNTGSS